MGDVNQHKDRFRRLTAWAAATLGRRQWPRSGLIRASLAGALVFCVVAGGAWYVGDMLRKPSRLTVTDAQHVMARTRSPETEYQRLRSNWIVARGLLNDRQAARQRTQAELDRIGADIAARQSALAETEAALELARTAATEQRAALEARAKVVTDLSAATLDRAVHTAQIAADEAVKEAAAAQQDLLRIKAEEVRLRAALTDLRAGKTAAETAAPAGDPVQTAAATETPGTGTDAPATAGPELEKAITDTETRLAALATQRDAYQARFAEANQLEQEAHRALGHAKEALARHRAALASAEDDRKIADDALAAAHSGAETAEQRRAALTDELATLRADHARATALLAETDKTLQSMTAEFARIDVALKGEQGRHSERAAASIAALNVQLTETLTGVLGDQPMDVPVFDRVVLSSERLFDAGSATISDEGRKTLRSVMPVVRDIVAHLPTDIDWVLRVDGHTDSQPLSGTGRFKDNWELSQARALAVVKFLIAEKALDPRQLSANGFGEHQPINLGVSDIAHAQNRRIELALAAR